jgi:hypothetical protein
MIVQPLVVVVSEAWDFSTATFLKDETSIPPYWTHFSLSLTMLVDLQSVLFSRLKTPPLDKAPHSCSVARLF